METEIIHRYDRRDTDNLADQQVQWTYCITCKCYHQIQMIGAWKDNNRHVETLINK